MSDTSTPGMGAAGTPPDRPPDHANRLNPSDQGTAMQLDRGRNDKGQGNGPVSQVDPLNMPLTLSAGDNIIDFGRRVHEYTIVNESGATIRRELDAQATAGSFPVQNGQTLNERKRVRKLHIYIASGTVQCNDAVPGVRVEGGIL